MNRLNIRERYIELKELYSKYKHIYTYCIRCEATGTMFGGNCKHCQGKGKVNIQRVAAHYAYLVKEHSRKSIPDFTAQLNMLRDSFDVLNHDILLKVQNGSNS